LYLPGELLAVAGVEIREPVVALENPRIAVACDALAERAENHFREARRLLAGCNRRALWPALIMMASYRRILAKLRAKGGWPVTVRPKLGAGERLWLVMRVAAGAEP
jgi:phytoene synthase